MISDGYFIAMAVPSLPYTTVFLVQTHAFKLSGLWDKDNNLDIHLNQFLIILIKTTNV